MWLFFNLFFSPPLGVEGEGGSGCMVFSCQLDSNHNRVIWCLSSLPSLQAKSSKNPQDTILRSAACQDNCFDFEHEIHLQKLYWKTLQQYFICDHLQGFQKVLEIRSKQNSAFIFLTLRIKFQLVLLYSVGLYFMKQPAMITSRLAVSGITDYLFFSRRFLCYFPKAG